MKKVLKLFIDALSLQCSKMLPLRSFLIVSALVFSSVSIAFAENTDEQPTYRAPGRPDYVIQDSMKTLYPQYGRKFFVELGGSSALNLGRSNMGGFLAAGYQFNPIGVDFKAMFLSATYGGLVRRVDGANSSAHSPTGQIAAEHPESEVNRERSWNDSWSGWFVQPGLVIENKFVQDRFPLLFNNIRVGVGYGRLTDTVNSVGFKCWLVSTEALVGFRLGSSSPMAVQFGGAWNFGAAQSDLNNTDGGRLPISWFNMILSFKRWF